MTGAQFLGDAAAEAGFLLRATLLMGAAWASAAALRKAGAPAAARHIVWLLGIGALLALPLLWWLAPALRLPILPPEPAVAALSAPAVPALAGATPPASSADGGVSLLLLLTYSLGATALLLRLLIGRRILARLWREADALPDPAWQRLLSRLSSEMLLSRPVELRIARGPIMPMTWGTLAPKVLLPAEASEWAPERRRLVLLHELAHVARRDSLSRSVASLACALYWFHPGAWLAARQMRVEQEHAADDRVLAAGGSAQAYARSLLHLARGLEGPRPAHAATMAGACQLERRLTSITTPVRRDRPGPAFLSFAVLCALLATLVVAAGVPVSPSSLLPNPLRAGPGGIASLPPPPAARPVAAVAEHRASKDALAAPGESQERDRSRRPDSSPRQDEAKSLGAAESPDRQQPPATLAELPDYRWQLPQRGSAMQIAAIPGPSNANRVLLTPPPASDERSARLKWPRMVPRPVLPATTTRSNPFTPRRPLMLSWSLDAAPR